MFRTLALVGLFSISAFAKSGAEETFEKLKALQGDWVNAESQDVATYEVISNGSAVVERAGGMVTVFHLDNGTIMATHYCAAQNQPRLRATEFSGEIIEFEFVDVTNAKDHPVYINHLSLKLIDKDNFVAVWKANKGEKPETFTYKRSTKPKLNKDNLVSYFEIPTTDIDRAAKFYGEILDTKLFLQKGDGYAYAEFTKRPNGGNNGALVQSKDFKPAAGSTMVYLYVDGDLDTVLKKVAPAGGKVLFPKTKIPGDDGDGYFAWFSDTEGNSVGLHSEK
jgi:uncharacterized protein